MNKYILYPSLVFVIMMVQEVNEMEFIFQFIIPIAVSLVTALIIWWFKFKDIEQKLKNHISTELKDQLKDQLGKNGNLSNEHNSLSNEHKQIINLHNESRNK